MANKRKAMLTKNNLFLPSLLQAKNEIIDKITAKIPIIKLKSNSNSNPKNIMSPPSSWANVKGVDREICRF